jgi:hypothetical protein
MMPVARLAQPCNEDDRACHLIAGRNVVGRRTLRLQTAFRRTPRRSSGWRQSEPENVEDWRARLSAQERTASYAASS